jgi:hypothetical protein
MRDILNLLDNLLAEAKLSASAIAPKKLSGVINPVTETPYTRQQLFLQKVKVGSPFDKIDGSQVVIKSSEARKVAAWLATGPAGVIVMSTTDGGTVKNTELQKTLEFGSKESENIKIKGSDVFDTEDAKVSDFGNSINTVMAAGGFPAIDMYSAIANSPQIKQLGKLGDAVIYMARQITEGQVPRFPPDLSAQEIKAIELYASEYLGVLSLISGLVPFKQGNRQDFDNFIGTDLGSMIMYFPKSPNNPLADSFSVTNDSNGHSIKISSKAAGKGAPPSLTSLKLPDDVREKYPEAAAFLDSAQDLSVSTFAQPFAMLNTMYEVSPGNVPKEYQSLMPFSDQLVSQLESTVQSGKPMPGSVMSKFYQRLSPEVINSDNTDGGKAWYAVTTDVIKAVNKGSAVPNLREALIESLGYNFIQLYSNVKGDRLITEAFWPAKLNGNVKLKTKGSASNPKKGKLSVEISPGKESETIAIGSSSDIGPGAEKLDTDELDAETNRPRLTGPGAKASKAAAEPKMDTATTGRAKRKPGR